MHPWDLYILGGAFGIYTLVAIVDYLWPASMELEADRFADHHEHIDHGDII